MQTSFYLYILHPLGCKKTTPTPMFCTPQIPVPFPIPNTMRWHNYYSFQFLNGGCESPGECFFPFCHCLGSELQFFCINSKYSGERSWQFHAPGRGRVLRKHSVLFLITAELTRICCFFCQDDAKPHAGFEEDFFFY